MKQYIGDLSKENPKVAALMSDLVCDIEVDEDRYKGKSIRNVIENMKHNCIEKVVSEFCITFTKIKKCAKKPIPNVPAKVILHLLSNFFNIFLKLSCGLIPLS